MEQDKTCECCNQTFTPSRFHPHQKYCKECGKNKKREKIREWFKKNGREYMRKYMRHYRHLVILISLMLIAADWQETKKGTILENMEGQISLQGTYIKPPKYQLTLKLSDNSFLTMNRFQISKRGWIPPVTDEENAEFEQKEAGGWRLEYGGQSVMSETALLEQDSVWGWKATFGQTAEFAWGQGSYGDRIAMASVNTEKYQLMFVKSWGQINPEEYYNPDTPTPKATTIPRTRYQGGDIKIPFRWRQTTGDIELAWKQRYDEQEQKNVCGFAVAIGAYTPRIRINVRDITKNFESQTRTTDIQIRASLYKPDIQTQQKAFSIQDIYAGAGVIDFSGQVDSRYSAITGAIVKIYGVNISPDISLYKAGNTTGLTYTGTISGSILNTNISVRRGESITGLTISRSNSASISRKEGSINFNYSESATGYNYAQNIDSSISLNLPYNIRITAGGGLSKTDTPTTLTTYKRGNLSATIKDTTFSAYMSPTNESYTLSRRLS